MDRYNEVKVLLKKWEQSFVQLQQRKPNKEDIDNAPEDTKKLYKEYRSLKQAKENTDSQSDPSGQNGATVEVKANPKDSDSWGTHLNRSNMPVPSPGLTPRERDSLQTSAQYYGAKLKSNLGSLGKERPVSLRKSLTPGRTPLKSWKDRLTEQPNSPGAGAAAAASPLRAPGPALPSLGRVSSPFSPRRAGGPFTGSPAPREPEEPFDAFKPSPQTPLHESPCTGGGNGHSPGLEFPSPRPARTAPAAVATGTPGRTAGVSGRLGVGVEPPDGADGKTDPRTQRAAGGPADGDAPLGLGGERRGGFHGGPGRGGPSLLSGLGSVDRGWLERCQVFGEVDGGDRPVAGNTQAPAQRGARPMDRDGNREARGRPGTAGGGGGAAGGAGAGEDGKENKTEKKAKQDDEPESQDAAGKRQVTREAAEASEGAAASAATEATVDANPPTRRGAKAKGGRGNRKEPEEQSTAAETLDQADEEVPVRATKASKRGRKRQREAEEGDGREAEEEQGAPTKRKRGPRKKKKTEEGEEEGGGGGGGGADGGTTPVQKETKRKRRVRKGEEPDEEEEGSTKTKAPEKDPQENLLGEVEEGARAYRAYKTQPARESKISDANFVKINLKKKSHVKGYALRGAGLRKQMYMQKFQLKGERFGGGAGGGSFRGRRGGFRGGFSRQGDTCYKCGGAGHWAMDCKGPAPPPSVPDDQPAAEEPFELPTLEEVARATGTLKCQSLDTPSTTEEGQPSEPQGPDGKRSDEVLLNVIRPDYERPEAPPPMEPLYCPGADGKVQATPEAVTDALRELGYQSFRPGQEDAIMRILSGLSTLVVLSTGMGKSLCYQLPAYLYAQRSKCITLVISPLVSLMDDQLSGIPAKLKAACIHSNMSMKQREAAIEKVKSGQVCVLLLSPEALVGGGGSGSGCLPPAHQLPPVAFACIDEAHCVSEWSHNFRPCYLRLCKVLRERLGVRCLLGLTATATLSTALDIAHHLDIHDQDGIAVRSAAVPHNLQLSVSMDRDKDQALVSLLKGDRFGCLDSIIVYCTRREETVRIAALLRTCLQGVVVKENPSCSSQAQSNPAGQKKKDLARKKIRKPLKWQAEAYHAGLSASERRRVQNNFMCGELRVTVATVAFGMGLDKADVRGIVHYNMPKSFESYVQEIGRAGRDGFPAHCHLFLDPEGGDLHELRRHIYADTVDYYTVKKLVQKVFPPCKCRQIHQKQLDLAERKEDIELLEMMDFCEQESSLNPPTQPDLVQPMEPVQQGEVPSPSSAEVMDSTPHLEEEKKRGENEKEKEEEEEEVNELSGSSGPISPSDPTVPGGDSTTDQEVKLKESSDWPAERLCHTHERAIPIQETVETLDITEEGVETLLCYLELHPQRFVELLHPTLSVCKISCYDGPRQLQRITKICPPVAVVLARKRAAGERVESCDRLEFDVVEVADTMGWQLSLVKRGLRQLQWSTERAGRSGTLVEFSSISFYFRSYGDLDDEEMDRVCEFLHRRVQAQERTQLYQLSACFKAFQSVGYRSVVPCLDGLDEGRSLRLKALLSEYFDKKLDRDRLQDHHDAEDLNQHKLSDWEDQIRADIRGFLSNRSDEKFSGRAVARILHGIASPCYPAQTYGRDRRYWRKYIKFDFNQLIRLATQEIIRFK